MQQESTWYLGSDQIERRAAASHSAECILTTVSPSRRQNALGMYFCGTQGRARTLRRAELEFLNSNNNTIGKPQESLLIMC